MYKVLIVDDEAIIRDGIAAVIDWEQYGFTLIGAAPNGVEALEMIQVEPPHIVITDLRMPVLDGLELIARVKQTYPGIAFVVLSGYGEFESAKTAMHYGVRHYLLKPCNENQIIQVLLELKEELQSNEQKEEFIRKNRENLEKVLPLVKEQFLRDFIANRNYVKDEYPYYRHLFGLEDLSVRLVLYEPEAEAGFEELFGLVQIIEDCFAETSFLNTVIKNQVLSLVQIEQETALASAINRVKNTFKYYHNLEVTVAYSEERTFEAAPLLYNEMRECLKHSIYVGVGSIITKRDIELSGAAKGPPELFFDFDSVAVAVKSGNLETVHRTIADFFKQLRQHKFPVEVVKTYATQLLTVLIRQCRTEELKDQLDKVVELQRIETVEGIESFIQITGWERTKDFHSRILSKHSRLIQTLLQYVQEHLGDENLSLKQLAAEVVFMNEDYLSKLFVKETGEKFSNFLMKQRMERAKELIGQASADRIYEIAQSVGLGNNPQYFSQLFKKYTGMAPSEYKKAN
ncbi:two-component system response regulator YesN [Hydrogenispora ethanolica]|uniref:Two-component system response regulator YesN n=1 Tax=Hydrogenispora ethanolica TaxID=1082276 RepID=A0A4R1RTR1_HYDET|nr:response regulator transcription factor [Hydrogenispora ethanolica]TCL69921.1 two-component system response regulator YesN [Hydrogenispora ethanolica]